MEKYLTPDGQIKCPKCGQVQPVSEVCVSCDIYFKKYEVSLRKKEERKIKQRAVEKSGKAYIQADCNKEDVKKAVKEFLVLDEVLVAAFSWTFDPRENSFPYFKPGTLSKNYLLLTNKGNLVFWAPWVEKGHAIIPAKSISEFKTKRKLLGNGGIYLYAKEKLKASFNTLELEKVKNYIGHFIKYGGDITIEDATKGEDQITLDGHTKLEIEKTPDPQAEENSRDNIPVRRKIKKERKDQNFEASPKNQPTQYGCGTLILIGIVVIIFANIFSSNDTSAPPKETRKERIEKGFFWWDGSHRELTKVIKKSMHDPDSYEHEKTVYLDNGDHLIVKTTFRGKNAFGGVVKNTVTAKVDLDGNVIQILSQRR